MRIDHADLVAMARRANTVLTDEGAKNWYQTDVRRLLNEIVALRTERSEALQSFQAFMQGEYDEGECLQDVAERWRETASGLWEKAQVKKLKAQLDEAKADAQNADRVLELLQDNYSAMSIELTRTKDEVAGLQRRLREQAEMHEAAAAAQLERIREFGELTSQLEQKLVDVEAEMQRKVMADAQLAEQRSARVRAHLAEAMEML
jgi:hypothetical protein